jgi:hypothetical protein
MLVDVDTAVDAAHTQYAVAIAGLTEVASTPQQRVVAARMVAGMVAAGMVAAGMVAAEAGGSC